MSDIRRLLDDPDAQGFDRDLVRAWTEQKPSPAAIERAMGLGTIAASTVAASVAAAATASASQGGAAAGAKIAAGAAGGSIPPKAAAVGAGALVKWLVAGGAIVAASSVATVHYLDRPAPAPVAAPAPAVSSTAAALPSISTNSTNVPVARVDTLPSAPSAPSASAHVRSSRSDPSALEEQIRAMDRIREALAAGDGRRALAQIDDYERRYPRGAFVEEAEVDRIDALVRTGDRAGAGRAAERFLARWPASPHGARVRALVGATTP